MKRKIWLLGIWIFHCTLVLSEAQAAQEDRALSFSLRPLVQYGPVEGFLQTPAGGRPGSSSEKRPALEELNIDDGLFYDLELAAAWKRLAIFAGAQWIHLDGRSTLDEPLITHGESYAAGDQVGAEINFDWYRFGGGWKFEAFEGRVEIAPKLEFALLDFRYELSDAIQNTKRDYMKAVVRPGLLLLYQASPRLVLRVDGATSLPLSNTPQISTVTAGVEYKVFKSQPRIDPWLFLGGGFERIDYEDNQELPNHVELELGPFISGGIVLRF